ncbi:MAG: hypothetical protein QNK37_15390 [Acidobacteriota bacterium]|nr:hypothetical protein [Acidobacteriota bacterium]
MDTIPDCPFCETPTQVRHVPGLSHLFRIYNCPACHAEIKQPISVPPEGPPPADTRNPNTECPDCAFSDFNCFACDDPVCERHIRTFEKYSRFVSPDLGTELVERYGNRIYCPLCFQNAFNRFSRELTQSTSKPERRSPYNFPLILGLLIILVIIMIGLRNCDAAKQLNTRQDQFTAGRA